LEYFGVWHYAVGYLGTNISVKTSAWRYFLPWRWRMHIPSKHWHPRTKRCDV